MQKTQHDIKKIQKLLDKYGNLKDVASKLNNTSASNLSHWLKSNGYKLQTNLKIVKNN